MRQKTKNVLEENEAMKKLITAVMTFIFAFTCLFSISAFASDEQIQPRASVYFDSYSATVIPEGGGNITVEITVEAKKSMTELGFTKVIIQEKNGSSWADVKTFTHSEFPFLITKNGIVHAATLSYEGISGKIYRAKITVYAKNASGSDTKTFTSSDKTA